MRDEGQSKWRSVCNGVCRYEEVGAPPHFTIGLIYATYYHQQNVR